MDLFLYRTHFREGTNGMLFHKQHFICFCVELPWRCNIEHVSCIPDGVYELEPFYSLNVGHHLRVLNVDSRNGILVRSLSANAENSKGAIVPVLKLDGIGKGSRSKEALHKILLRLEACRSVGKSYFITISSAQSGR